MPSKSQAQKTETVVQDATSQSLLRYPTAQAKKPKEGLNQTEKIHDYLRRLPGYPYDPELDRDYVEELVEDFSDVNILAEIKAFRWYYNNEPFSASSAKPRVALLRWLDNAWPAT